ncbi:MAG TPA: NTP transferase domain-containing protein [Candidatus Limnocylindrales bacterium]|nr:NTP transferase domain-containing protein [Candidatus Limnocylindrales bacterium]
MTHPARVGAVVLAAGAAKRFGGEKLLAPLQDRPVLQHVLDTLATIGLGEVVVVLGSGARAVEAGIVWHGERIVRNPHPEQGLSSSLRTGIAALGVGRQAALIVLGDQPDLQADVIRALLTAETTARRPIVVPAYDHGGGRNPVLIRRSGWPWIETLRGDRGLGIWLAEHPEEVLEVPVEGLNPDVDTPADLALLAWGHQVRADREQVERCRESADGADFYVSTSSIFRDDPDRTDDPVLDALVAFSRPDDVWLDVGAGAGRYALPLARRVREVVALDPSPAMLGALRELQAKHGIDNVTIIEGRWPLGPDATLPGADVALMAHVGYDIEAIGPFLDAFEAAAKRTCLALLMEHAPASLAEPLWPPVHGEPRSPLPGLDAFVELLRARGRSPQVQRLPVAEQARRWEDLEAFARRQTWVAPGSDKEARLLETLHALAVQLPDGGWTIPHPPRQVGVVAWTA